MVFALVPAIFVLCACARPAPSAAAPALVPVAPASVAGPQVPVAQPQARTPVLVIDDPAQLATWNASDLAFAKVALGPEAAADRTLAALAQRPDIKLVVDAVRADLDAAAKKDPKSGVGLRYSHRRFNPAWLTSADSTLVLVAIVNRPDRQPFATDHCGETRLVYRVQFGSFLLPMTWNAVYWQDPDPGQTCADVARRWLASPDLAPAERAKAAVASAVSGRTNRARLKSLETNVQTVRWPSSVRGDLGGHAEYSLRAFHPDAAGALRKALLENTPDIAALRSHPPAKGALLQWLRDAANLAAIDRGVVRVPDKFLATQATSVTPHGFGRLTNRPWRQVFGVADLAGLPLQKLENLRTPAGLLRRLDSLTCQGCHQSRSVAGFHITGRQPLGTPDGLGIAVSPHLHGLLPFRARAAQWLTGEAAAPSPNVPHAELPAKAGRVGDHCGLGDAAFAGWGCSPGLRCVSVGDREVGACAAEKPLLGSPCDAGPLSADPDAHRDGRIAKGKTACQAGGFCESAFAGFPGGICAGPCEASNPVAACAAIPIFSSFNACLAKGLPFARCAADNHNRKAMPVCSPDAPCRDDYVCTPTPDGQSACMPPYFLLQLRVDGPRKPAPPR